MPRDVFISYSSKDQAVADQTCQALESNGITCWIAPRDIQLGETWGDAVMAAIKDSKVMVVVFSENANVSKQVISEVERAVHYEKTIISLRIEDTKPSAALELHLSIKQWLDAFQPPPERHLEHLATVIKRLLEHPGVDWEKAVRSSNSASVKLKWPNAWSYFAAGDDQVIKWDAVASDGVKIERFTIELYLDGVPVRRIGETLVDPAARSDNHPQTEWRVPFDLPNRNNYQVKVTAWDNRGRIGSATSSCFSVTRPDDAWGLWVVVVATLSACLFAQIAHAFVPIVFGPNLSFENMTFVERLNEDSKHFDQILTDHPILARVGMLIGLYSGLSIGGLAGLTLRACPPFQFIGPIAAIVGAGMGWLIQNWLLNAGGPDLDLTFYAAASTFFLTAVCIGELCRGVADDRTICEANVGFWKWVWNSFRWLITKVSSFLK